MTANCGSGGRNVEGAVSAMTRPRTRSKVIFMTAEELRQLSTAELDAYIASLRAQLSLFSHGPVHKSLRKRVEVAVKVRAMR